MDNPSIIRPVRGRVARGKAGKNFGFIEPSEGAPIYFQLSDCDPDYQFVHAGDEVAFEYDENDGRPCARRVRFLGNDSLDGLRTAFEQGTVRYGFLKQLESDYYVKDVDTHIFIKLVISANEADQGEIYEGSLNQKRAYRLVRMSTQNSLRAVLEERRFKPALAELVPGEAYEAEVLYDIAGGYLVELVGLDIKGLLPSKEAYKQTIPLAIGVRVDVQLQSATSTLERLVFELTGDSREQFLNPAALAEWQARQLEAVGPGFRATATVKSVVNFGAFVAFSNYGDALLHIKNFLTPDSPAGTRAEKQALGDLLAELLPAKTELAVVVLDVDGPRCSVDLDMSVPANVALKAAFVQRQRLLLGAGT